MGIQLIFLSRRMCLCVLQGPGFSEQVAALQSEVKQLKKANQQLSDDHKVRVGGIVRQGQHTHAQSRWLRYRSLALSSKGQHEVCCVLCTSCDATPCQHTWRWWRSDDMQLAAWVAGGVTCEVSCFKRWRHHPAMFSHSHCHTYYPQSTNNATGCRQHHPCQGQAAGAE